MIVFDGLFREELESATHRLNAHVTELTQRLCKTETSLQANIHDYLSLRAETLQSTRHMQEQLVAANTVRDEALTKLADMQVLLQLHSLASAVLVCASRLPLLLAPPFYCCMQRKGEADIRATVQNVSSRDEVKLFEYRRQVRACTHARAGNVYLQPPPPSHAFHPPPSPPQADEARMELAACKSELACLTSAWEKKRQELSSQLNKYKSRCSALERKRSSDISGLAHDVNCLQRSVRQALTQLARVKSARETYPLPAPLRPLSNALLNTRPSSAAAAPAPSSSSSIKKKTGAGAGGAGAKGAPARARPASACVDIQEREEEEWRHEVTLLLLRMSSRCSRVWLAATRLMLCFARWGSS